MVSKKLIPLFLVIVLSLLALIIWISLNQATKNYQERDEVYINDELIEVEVVKSPVDIYRGLSNRPDICENCGMLFIFSDLQEREFVMRKMMFPLDIIFISDNEIVKIYENLEPEGVSPKNLYKSEFLIDKVLELNAGQVKKMDIKIGDKIILKLDE